MDNILKLKHTLDALFGVGTSRYLPKDTTLTFSRKNGRIKSAFSGDNLLCTLRIDGGLAITSFFAQILMRNPKFKENCLEIDEESRPFVEDGRSVFCKYVVWCGKNVKIYADTPILYQDKVIAVGKAVLPYEIIPHIKHGVAVKVRDSLKS